MKKEIKNKEKHETAMDIAFMLLVLTICCVFGGIACTL